RGPGGFTGGRAVDALVSHIDLFPTVCDLAGAEKPPWLQGESLHPLVNGEVEDVREFHFAVNT
ncbi:MAG: sulfatase/phosphatase domain-containing protein, partial [Rubrobacter sp.]